jgi:hypothetical protein
MVELIDQNATRFRRSKGLNIGCQLAHSTNLNRSSSGSDRPSIGRARRVVAVNRCRPHLAMLMVGERQGRRSLTLIFALPLLLLSLLIPAQSRSSATIAELSPAKRATNAATARLLVSTAPPWCPL